MELVSFSNCASETLPDVLLAGVMLEVVLRLSTRQLLLLQSETCCLCI